MRGIDANCGRLSPVSILERFQQILHQLGPVARNPRDRLEYFRLLVWLTHRSLFKQQMNSHLHAGQRGSQLVRTSGDEFPT